MSRAISSRDRFSPRQTYFDPSFIQARRSLTEAFVSRLKGNLSWLRVFPIMVGLMSGLLSIFREFLLFMAPGRVQEKPLFWACVRIAFVLSAATAWWFEHRTSSARAAQLEEIERAKPKIKLKQPGAVYTEVVALNFSQGRSTLSVNVPWLKVRFVNDPAHPYPLAKANGVRAKIDYYRCSDNSRVLSIDGRWAETDQPPVYNPAASKAHLLATTFGHGEEHSLDIAYRDEYSRQYYAWNNDNYSYPGFRYDRHRLDGDCFRVEIRLRGDYLDETFSFVFRPSQTGFEIES